MSAIPLRRSWNCRFPGLLIQEVDCYICDVIGAVGLLSSLQLFLSLEKNDAVSDGYRPVLAAAIIAAGVEHHSPPLGARVLCPRGQCWAVAGGFPNHGRQKPLPAFIYRNGNRHLYPMAGFFRQREGGPRTIEDIIVDVLAVTVVYHGNPDICCPRKPRYG